MAHDYLFKFILCGESSVGKTALLERFVSSAFLSRTDATVGIDFKTKIVSVGDKANVKLMIMTWDTAGQEVYKALTRHYFRGSAAAILVYDITKRTSFNALKTWMKDLRQLCDNPNMVYVLVGNKCDEEESREVAQEEGESFAKEFEMIFVEASAQNGVNVEEAWTLAAQAFYLKFESGLVDITSDEQGLTLGPRRLKGVGNFLGGKCQC